MKQIKSLLLLRAHQSYRFLNEIGFGFIAVAIFILTGFILTALQNILSAPAIGGVIFSIFLLISIELIRKDTFFIKSIFTSKQEFIIYKFIENILIVIPIMLFQAIFFRWDIILSIFIISGIVTILPFHMIKREQRERKTEIRLIPLSIFEIKFYFEKKIWSIIFLGILLFLGGLHMSLWVVGMVFLCVLPIEIYTPIESREMVKYKPNFVGMKIRDAYGIFLMFVTLPIIITFYFSQVNFLVLLYGVIALLLSLALSISKKYASYYGVTELMPSTTSTMILIFLMLAPGGILITFSASIYYYLKAEKHMKRLYATI